MLALRILSCLPLTALLLSAAAPKTVATAKGENQDLALTVTLYIAPADIQALIGDDLGGHYIVADVKVEPKYGKEVALDLDDFQIRTDLNGERATPYAPSQIAGRDALIVHPQEDRTGNAAGPGSGVPFPRRNPKGSPRGGASGAGSPQGDAAPNAGSGAQGGSGNTSAAAGTVDTRDDDKENPLLRTLTDKELPAKKTDQPLAGLLYFIMEKQKMKDLEFSYGRKENRITLRFK